MAKKKREFKKTDLSPMTTVEVGKDIKIAESKTIDLSHLDAEALREAFKKINKKAKQTRPNGVIVTHPHGKYAFICTSLNSGANKKNVLSFPEPSISRIYLNVANENFHFAQKIQE